VRLHCTIGFASETQPVRFRPELRTKALTSTTNGVLRMSEELQGSFSSIEVVVRRRGFAYPWSNPPN
jgi:hypothetical protein